MDTLLALAGFTAVYGLLAVVWCLVDSAVHLIRRKHAVRGLIRSSDTSMDPLDV